MWGIHEADNILCIQGDDRVVKYLNGKYTAIEMNAKIDCSNMVNGILYIGTDRGVWVLVGNTFFPLQDCGSLASNRIRGIIPHMGWGIIVVTIMTVCFIIMAVPLLLVITVQRTLCVRTKFFVMAAQDDKRGFGNYS